RLRPLAALLARHQARSDPYYDSPTGSGNPGSGHGIVLFDVRGRVALVVTAGPNGLYAGPDRGGGGPLWAYASRVPGRRTTGDRNGWVAPGPRSGWRLYRGNLM